MATKTITVTEDAYRLLKRQKRPGESFSEVIRRTFGGGSARALVGLLSDEEAAELEKGIEARRSRRRARSERRDHGRL